MGELPPMPRNLPVPVAKAQLPATYESAKAALAECYRVDECKEWADKMMALASYARQVQDNSLYETAAKIHGRAIKRVGELLKTLAPAHGKGGGRPSEKTSGRHRPDVSDPPSRSEAARGAGLSERQQKTALRVANIPDDDFEELIEQSPPPTVTELAERGKKSAPRPLLDLGGRDPEDFQQATAALGAIRDIKEFSARANLGAIARGVSGRERARLIADIPAVRAWLADFSAAIKGEKK